MGSGWGGGNPAGDAHCQGPCRGSSEARPCFWSFLCFLPSILCCGTCIPGLSSHRCWHPQLPQANAHLLFSSAKLSTPSEPREWWSEQKGVTGEPSKQIYTWVHPWQSRETGWEEAGQAAGEQVRCRCGHPGEGRWWPQPGSGRGRRRNGSKAPAPQGDGSGGDTDAENREGKPTS